MWCATIMLTKLCNIVYSRGVRDNAGQAICRILIWLTQTTIIIQII